MSSSAFTVLILAIVGATGAWIGYAIKYQRRYHLIAGFDPTKVRNPDALARWTGNSAFVMAGICAAGIIGVLVMPGALRTVLVVVAFATVAVAIAATSGAIKRKW